MDIGRAIARIARRIFRVELADVHTHVVCQVVSYDENTNLVSLQPCIQRVRSGDPNNLTCIQLPQIDDVPVQQKGSGKCHLTVAPQDGSYGNLHVSERSLDSWMAQGGIVAPSSSRRFDIGDGFFEPGTYPQVDDGDNGKLSPAVRTDRIELRTRDLTAFVAVLDDGTVKIEAGGGTFTIDGSGQVNINNNFTVDK